MNKNTKIMLEGRELTPEEDYVYFEAINTLVLHDCFIHWNESRKLQKDNNEKESI